MSTKMHPLFRQAQQERESQIARGYTAEADQQAPFNRRGELADAASYMARTNDIITLGWREDGLFFPHTLPLEALFPDNWDRTWHTFRDGKTAQERLVVAVALLMAEWDRLEALAKEPQP